MQIRQGIATEYAKEKFDITLDESDLIRMAIEYGFDPKGISQDQVYLLMTLEASRYVLVQSPKYGRPLEQAREQLAVNREEFASVLAAATGIEMVEARKRAGL